MTAQTILPANTLSSGSYQVDNSLRFEDASNDYLSRSVSSSGNRRTWTWSGWVKRSNTTQQYQNMMAMGSNNIRINFSNQNIWVYDYNGSGFDFYLVTNRLFRDISAWYHIVVAVDTTQGTDSNRVKLYVNGVQETSFSTETYPSQNHDTEANTSSQNNVIGTDAGSLGNNSFHGYMCEVVLIDGQALDPTSFGEFDSDSGIWKPINVSGLTFGTNGFYLEFKGSGTSANSSGLGADTSGNTHHFTVNNLTSVDQTTDTCTNNFCTWNAIAAPYSAPTLSEGNTKVTNNTSQWQGAIGTFGLSQGKWYWEARFDTTTYTYNHGVIDESVNFSDQNPMNANGYTGFYNYDGGEIRYNGGTTSSNYGTFGTNDIIGIALNMDDKQISFYKNGNAIVSNFGLSTTGQTLVFPSTTYYSGGYCSYNFGNASYTISSGNSDADGFGNFEYSVPSGYFALCTKNLAEYG